MKVIRTVIGEVHPLTDIFIFDDGLHLTFKHDEKWILRHAEISIDIDEDVSLDFRVGFLTQHMAKKEYWRYADHVWYILSCHISYIRYYNSVKELFNVYSTQFEYHNFLDIKHRCRNLRKAGKFAWAHYDILRNMQEYVDYAKESRFGRESLLNFYSRFLKLSILKNNKHLSWIIDETDTFIHYGFVMSMNGDSKSIRCGCKECKCFGTGCPIDEQAKGFEVFTIVDDDNADSWDRENVTCKFQVPHPKDKERQCAHQQYYKPKSRYNKRVGVRQQTKEIVKMQLTNEPFELNGLASYPLYEKYADRMTVKSRSVNSFLIMMRYIHNMSTVEIPTEPNTDPNQDIVLTVQTFRKKLTTELMDVAVRYLIENKANLYGYVMYDRLTSEMFSDLYQISKERDECQNGPLKRLKDLVQQRKLMSN